MEDRLTATDYRKKHKDLLTKVDSLEGNIAKRLAELVATHPKVVIATHADLNRTPVYCEDVQVKGLNTIKLKLETIDAIELALSKLSPIQEQELPFN